MFILWECMKLGKTLAEVSTQLFILQQCDKKHFLPVRESLTYNVDYP